MSEFIIAVDFDGTVVRHEFPEIGEEVPHCVDVLKTFQKFGFKIILWTMRSGEHLDAAVAWFAEREIALFGINNNPQQVEWTTSPKAYAQLYIDDAAFGCPLIKPSGNGERPYVDWKAVKERMEWG